MDNKNTPEKKQSGSNTILRFSGIAFQMAVVIALGAWGGSVLDERMRFEKPIFTVVGSLLGVGISLYLVIRAALRIDK